MRTDLIQKRLSSKRADEQGASAVEYGLLVAAIAAVIIIVVFTLGSYVHGAFSNTCSAFATNATNIQGNGTAGCA